MSHGDKEFDEQYYKRFFVRYDKKELDMYYRWSIGWARFLDKYIPLLDGTGKEALEIGSSIGAFSKVLNERGFRVVATDVSPHIVLKAKRLQKSINFKTLNIERGRLKGKFDYIFAFEVVEHLIDPKKGIANMRQMLKKNGTIVLSTPFPTKRSTSDPTHVNVHKALWWVSLAKKIDFRKVKVIYATFVPFLYRLSKDFSIGFPFKSDIPYVNSTCFIILQK